MGQKIHLPFFLIFMTKIFNWGWLVALLILPILLWVLPSDFFDSEDGIILCPSRLFFGIECLGCGMTRAIMHLHHFELGDALFFNNGVVVIYPILIIVWFIWVKGRVRRLGLLKP